MDVTLPNGQIIKGVPDGTPKEDIARKAIEAGLATEEDFPEIMPEQGFLSQIKQAFTGEGQTTPEIEALPGLGDAPEMNELSKRAFNAALGTMTTGDTDELKAIFKQQYGDDVSFTEDSKGNTIINFPSGQYPLNRPGFSAQDIPKLIADFAAFTPAGRAGSLAGAAGKSAIAEAGLEAVEAGVGGEFSPGDVATSAALGGALKGAEDVLGAGYRAIKGQLQPAGQQLVEESAEAGIPILTSDVLPPQTFAGRMAQQTAEKIPVAGTGAARETQQELRSQAVREFTDQFGDFSYKSIVDSLKTQKDKIKSAAGNVLESAGQKLDDAGEISVTNTLKAADNATAQLTKPGVIQTAKGIDDLNVLLEALRTPQTYSTLKENRTAFREIVDSLDPAARSQLTSRGKALLKGVENAMTKDMQAFAKGNLSAQEFMQLNKANKAYAQEAAKLSKTRLKNVLDSGDFTPENVKQMLFSNKPSEIKNLYQSLTNEGRQNARAAIIQKVVDDLGRRANGLTPNSFASELKKYGPQIGTFFKGKDKKQLEGLRRALEATRRAQEAAVTTPTGQQLLGAGTLAAAATDLGATIGLGGTAGGLARIYESAPVRNALLKLAGTPKGSSAFEQSLRELNEVLIPLTQTAQSEVPDRG
jgi:hypothetical protein